VKLLLDEQLDTPDLIVMRALNEFRSRHDCEYASLRTASPGLKDPEIPAFCRASGVAALISFNIRDFAAKLELYKALLLEGISVVALRPKGREAFNAERQLSLIALHSRTIARWLDEQPGPHLLMANFSGIKPRSLNQLVEEIEGKAPRLP